MKLFASHFSICLRTVTKDKGQEKKKEAVFNLPPKTPSGANYTID